MRAVLIIVIAFSCWSCRPTDTEPNEVMSFSYRTDGSRHIAPTAVPKVTTKIISSTLVTDNVRFTTTPVPFTEGQGFAVGTANGEIDIFNDSLTRRIKLPTADPIFRLATQKDRIVTLQNSGALTAVTRQGEILWRGADSLSRADLVLAENAVLVIADEGVACYDLRLGEAKFFIRSPLTPVSAIVYQGKYYVAWSWKATTGSDSIYVIDSSGSIEKRMGIPGSRITSNLAIGGNDHDRLLLGIQGEPGPDGIRRKTSIEAYSLSNWQHTLHQELEYIPTNVSASGDIVLASGFQMAGQDYAGAADAFIVSSGNKLWQHRFTEALASPVAVTTQHAFFSLSFTSKADIPSSSIFYAIDLTSGEIVREVAVTDARNGFVPGLPVPYLGALLLADAAHSTIYKLTAE